MQAGGDNDPIDVVDLSTVAVQTGERHAARHTQHGMKRATRAAEHALGNVRHARARHARATRR